MTSRFIASTRVKNYFPAFASMWNSHVKNPEGNLGGWKNLEYDFALWPIIPFRSNEIDIPNSNFQAPGAIQKMKSRNFRHWLGTDVLGRDVAAGMIQGCRVSIIIALISTLLAGLIGFSDRWHSWILWGHSFQIAPLETLGVCVGSACCYLCFLDFSFR